MEILYTKSDVQTWTEKIKAQGDTICLVPTMGFFHDGHLALMKRARALADTVLVTLFVNPTQFAKGEDLSDYPRDFKADVAKAQSVGVDAFFCPDVTEMYPQKCQTVISVPVLARKLCGITRPTHFDGVATVVTKLFNICRPDCAIFGEKDFQQLAVIRQVVCDLNAPVQIYSLPIVREHDGLAMSSRNTYLTKKQREQALCLSQGIVLGRKCAKDGKDSLFIIKEITMLVERNDGVVDYISIINQFSLDDCQFIDTHSVLVMAVKIGKTRLIDNGFLLIGDNDVSLNA